MVRFVEGNFGIMEGALTFADLRGRHGRSQDFLLSANPAPVPGDQRSAVGEILLDEETVRPAG